MFDAIFARVRRELDGQAKGIKPYGA
jgi:hypothetical protein